MTVDITFLEESIPTRRVAFLAIETLGTRQQPKASNANDCEEDKGIDEDVDFVAIVQVMWNDLIYLPQMGLTNYSIPGPRENTIELYQVLKS